MQMKMLMLMLGVVLYVVGRSWFLDLGAAFLFLDILVFMWPRC